MGERGRWGSGETRGQGDKGTRRWGEGENRAGEAQSALEAGEEKNKLLPPLPPPSSSPNSQLLPLTFNL